MDEQQLTPLSELGEFGLITRLSKLLPYKEGKQKLLTGIGDDAAVVQINEKECMLLSTDSLFENVHFDLVYIPLAHLGFKAISSSASDIVAMNAIPAFATINIACTAKITVEALEELYKGVATAAENYNINIVGGDTTASRAGLAITVSVWGFAPIDKVVYRKGAKPGDKLVVSGDLGSAYLGLQILEREKRVFIDEPHAKPELGDHQYILGRQLRPLLRLDILQALEKLDIQPTSMIDISDGLASECFHLAASSGVGIELQEELLPIDSSARKTAMNLGLDPTLCILSGGEDYELLMTMKPEDAKKITHDFDFTEVGVVTESDEGLHLITRSGNKHKLKAQGWNHFEG